MGAVSPPEWIDPDSAAPSAPGTAGRVPCGWPAGGPFALTTMDRAAATGDSSALPREAVEYLRREGEEAVFADGDVVVRRGDPGVAFYVVLSGSLEVLIRADSDSRLSLLTLTEGAFFGEMSILTGDPVSADVAAAGPVRLLRFPAGRFAAAVSECRPLREHVMAGLARSLRRTTHDAWNFYQRAEALNVLVDSRPRPGEAICLSPAMKRALELLDGLPAGREPLLITGEPGTGKSFTASRVHIGREDGKSPFIVVDCRDLADDAVGFIFGTTWTGAEGCDPPDFGSIHAYGALHLAHGGTLVLRHVDTLDAPAAQVLADYLDGVLAGRVRYPLARVAATADSPPGGLLPGPLGPLFSGRSVAIPPLRERRRDILPLARAFLEAKAGGGRQLGLSAEHTLVSRQYTHRNVDELKEAVELAALFAEGPTVEAEHVFTGPKDQGGGAEYPLDEIPLVRRLTGRRSLKAARAVVFASFAAVVALCLLRGESSVGRAANAVTWWIWEPLLLVAFLFFGRIWCAVCPLSTAGRIAGAVRSFGRRPEGWLKAGTGWVVTAGFAAVVLAEHAFHMTVRPAAAAGLLLALAGGAVVSSVVYQRETWCRYLCPLGALGAVYSLPSVVTLRANTRVCSVFCRTHECFKGSGDLPGCPVFHHPLYARDAHHCKQCCTCLWTCPHGSARLYLRPPLQGLWRQEEIGEGLLPFALFLVFFSPFMLASLGTSPAADLPAFALGAALAAAAAFLLLPRLPALVSGEGVPDRSLASRVVFSLLVLAWGPAMAFQIGHIEVLGHLALRPAGESLTGWAVSGAGVSLQTLLQLGAVSLGALLSALCLWGVRLHGAHTGTAFSTGGWRGIRLFFVLYSLTALLLVLPQRLSPGGGAPR